MYGELIGDKRFRRMQIDPSDTARRGGATPVLALGGLIAEDANGYYEDKAYKVRKIK
jgi:hypothetical protein